MGLVNNVREPVGDGIVNVSSAVGILVLHLCWRVGKAQRMMLVCFILLFQLHPWIFPIHLKVNILSTLFQLICHNSTWVLISYSWMIFQFIREILFGWCWISNTYGLYGPIQIWALSPSRIQTSTKIWKAQWDLQFLPFKYEMHYRKNFWCLENRFKIIQKMHKYK